MVLNCRELSALCVTLSSFALLGTFHCGGNDAFFTPNSILCSTCRTAPLHGHVSDCSCSFREVDAATSAYYHPILVRLTETRFFRFFRINLESECPFWDDSAETCSLKDCSVDTCAPDEIPSVWLNDEESLSGWTAAHQEDDCSTPEWVGQRPGLGDLSRNGAEYSDNPPVGVEDWATTSTDVDYWISPEDPKRQVYVSLLENPERYTGYTGDSPRRIWAAIYDENCFEEAGLCLEKRVFYRLISGLQSSITTHIASDFYFTGIGRAEGHWGPNTGLFVDRVGSHPERLHNLYFVYLFCLRAVAKVTRCHQNSSSFFCCYCIVPCNGHFPL